MEIPVHNITAAEIAAAATQTISASNFTIQHNNQPVVLITLTGTFQTRTSDATTAIADGVKDGQILTLVLKDIGNGNSIIIKDNANTALRGDWYRAVVETWLKLSWDQTASQWIETGANDGTGTASGINSHAEGTGTIASGESSHAEGNATTASGIRSHAEGNLTVASQTSAHAEGDTTTASGIRSHAEGTSTTANNENAHAEGLFGIASGAGAHAEGRYTTASGESAHAEGYGATATGTRSHAEGNGTLANGFGSHAEGGASSTRLITYLFATASGYFSAGGDAQFTRVVMRRQITHSSSVATWYSLFIDGVTATELFKIPANTVINFRVMIVGKTDDDSKRFAYNITGAIARNGANSTVILGTPTITNVYEADDTDYEVQAIADNNNEALDIQVRDTTFAGDTVRWVAVIEALEVGY